MGSSRRGTFGGDVFGIASAGRFLAGASAVGILVENFPVCRSAMTSADGDACFFSILSTNLRSSIRGSSIDSLGTPDGFLLLRATSCGG